MPLASLEEDRLDQTGGHGASEPAEVSLQQVFVQQTPQLKRVIAGMGLGACDAEDILQDVYVKVMKHCSRPWHPGVFARLGPYDRMTHEQGGL